MHLIKRLSLVTFGLASLSLSSIASAQTLAEALKLAAENAPEIKQATLETQLAETQIAQAKASGRLQLTAESNLGWQNVETNVPLNPDAGESITGGITLAVSRPIYTGGRIRAGVAAAQNGFIAQEAFLGSATQAIYYRTVTAYLDVWRDSQGVALAETALQLAQAQFIRAKDSFDLGVLTQTDVAFANANVAAAQAQYAFRQSQVEARMADFVYLTGVAPSHLDAPRPMAGLPTNLAMAKRALVKQNKTLEALNAIVDSTAEGVNQAKSAYKPQVSIAASGGHGQELRDEDYETSLGASIGLSLPLYTSGLRRAQVDQANVELRKARLEVQKTQAELGVELTRLWYLRASSQTMIKAAKAQISALETAYEGTEAEFEFGARAWVDVLDARQDLDAARQALIDARYNNYLATAGILNLLGRLSPEAF